MTMLCSFVFGLCLWRFFVLFLFIGFIKFTPPTISFTLFRLVVRLFVEQVVKAFWFSRYALLALATDCCVVVVCFFSSGGRHARCDGSTDVCAADLWYGSTPRGGSK